MDCLHCIGPLTAEHTNEHTITRACQSGKLSNRDTAHPGMTDKLRLATHNLPLCFGPSGEVCNRSRPSWPSISVALGGLKIAHNRLIRKSALFSRFGNLSNEIHASMWLLVTGSKDVPMPLFWRVACHTGVTATHRFRPLERHWFDAMSSLDEN